MRAGGGRVVPMMRQLFLTALVLAVLPACSGSPSSPSSDPVTEPGGQQAASPQGACATRSELACLDSPDCTLQLEGDNYSCVDPANDCEVGFVQGDGTRESCDQPGCDFVPAQCYCPPGLTCVCGGGPPAQCVPSTDG